MEQQALPAALFPPVCMLWSRQPALLLSHAATQLNPAPKVTSRPLHTTPPEVSIMQGSLQCSPLAVQERRIGAGSRWCPAQGWLCPSQPAALPPPASLCGTCTERVESSLNGSRRVLSHLSCHGTGSLPSAAGTHEQLLRSARALMTDSEPVCRLAGDIAWHPMYPPCLQSPVCTTGGAPGGSNRIMAAPGQWLASTKVMRTPSTVMGWQMGTVQMRSGATLSCCRTRRAVTSLQYRVPMRQRPRGEHAVAMTLLQYRVPVW